MTARVTFGATNFTATNDGIGRVSRLCALAMIEGGYEPDLISFLDKPPASLAGRPVKAMNGGKIGFAARCLASALPAGRPALYATAGLARAGRALPFLSAPYGVWIHGVEVWGEPAPRADYIAAIKGSRLIIANSAFTLDRAQEKLGPLPQGRRCWLATEQDEPAAPVARDGPPTVLILGRISLDEGYKGHDELVDAWPSVIRAAPDARLMIAGAGSGLDALRARRRLARRSFHRHSGFRAGGGDGRVVESRQRVRDAQPRRGIRTRLYRGDVAISAGYRVGSRRRSGGQRRRRDRLQRFP